MRVKFQNLIIICFFILAKGLLASGDGGAGGVGAAASAPLPLMLIEDQREECPYFLNDKLESEDTPLRAISLQSLLEDNSNNYRQVSQLLKRPFTVKVKGRAFGLTLEEATLFFQFLIAIKDTKASLDCSFGNLLGIMRMNDFRLSLTSPSHIDLYDLALQYVKDPEYFAKELNDITHELEEKAVILFSENKFAEASRAFWRAYIFRKLKKTRYVVRKHGTERLTLPEGAFQVVDKGHQNFLKRIWKINLSLMENLMDLQKFRSDPEHRRDLSDSTELQIQNLEKEIQYLIDNKREPKPRTQGLKKKKELAERLRREKQERLRQLEQERLRWIEQERLKWKEFKRQEEFRQCEEMRRQTELRMLEKIRRDELLREQKQRPIRERREREQRARFLLEKSKEPKKEPVTLESLVSQYKRMFLLSLKNQKVEFMQALLEKCTKRSTESNSDQKASKS